MKAKFLALLIVLVVGLAVLVGLLGAQPDQPLASGPNVGFSAKIGADLLDQAARLSLYKLAPPKLTQASLGDLTKRLFPNGLKGQTIRAGQVVAIADAERPSNFLMLEVRTGYLSFDRGLADQIDGRPGKLPGDEEAGKIALDFLGQAGLLPAVQKQLLVDQVTHIYSASSAPTATRQTTPVAEVAVVYLARQLDGVRVIGPGSKFVVRIGDGGQVVGGSARWREVEPAGTVKALGLRAPEQLQRQIAAFLGREYNQAKRITVENVGLSYFDRNGQYVQPVIGYEASILQGDNIAERYLGQVPLLTQPPEAVAPGALDPKLKEALLGPSQDLKIEPRGQD
jgi:hypothetical protein